MLESGESLRASVLRVGHHGSRFASSSAFLEAVRPILAVISVGARNPFRHPSPDTLARLEATGARVYRTDLDGAVIMETDGIRVWVTRWASRATEVFDLAIQPSAAPAEAPASENTAASGSAGGRDGTRGEREGD